MPKIVRVYIEGIGAGDFPASWAEEINGWHDLKPFISDCQRGKTQSGLETVTWPFSQNFTTQYSQFLITLNASDGDWVLLLSLQENFSVSFTISYTWTHSTGGSTVDCDVEDQIDPADLTNQSRQGDQRYPALDVTNASITINPINL